MDDAPRLLGRNDGGNGSCSVSNPVRHDLRQSLPFDERLPYQLPEDWRQHRTTTLSPAFGIDGEQKYLALQLQGPEDDGTIFQRRPEVEPRLRL